MSSRSSEENRIKALENISAAMLLQAMLPDRVFSGAWRYFRLCMSDDYIFTRRFVRAVHAFLLVEGSLVACMWNLREEDGMPTVFSFDAATTPMDFHDVLSGANEDFRNWAFDYGQYVCMSEVGEWCIHGDRAAGVAVVAFKEERSLEKYVPALEMIAAAPLDVLIELGGDPFGSLVPEWSEGLARNYGG